VHVAEALIYRRGLGAESGETIQPLQPKSVRA